ncbi:MAG: helix-turn-helix domain-containing protein [Acidimicrobiales bacterium]
MQLDQAVYQRILGDELRKVRRKRGWTRKELNEHLAVDVSLQTLATYELGTRQCSVVRLAELCLAMDEVPADLVARVHQRVFIEEPGRLLVDLGKVAVSTEPQLGPMRRWAADRLEKAGPAAPREIQLDMAALERMAELCELSTVDLVGLLRTQ